MPEYASDESVTDHITASAQMPSQSATSEQELVAVGCRSEPVSAIPEARRFPNSQDPRHITDILLSSEVALEFVVRYFFGIQVPFKILT